MSLRNPKNTPCSKAHLFYLHVFNFATFKLLFSILQTEEACAFVGEATECYNLWKEHCNGKDEEETEIAMAFIEAIGEFFECWLDVARKPMIVDHVAMVCFFFIV